MSIWKSVKDKLVVSRLLDEHIHGEAIREVEAGIRRDGLWAMALVQAGSDEKRVNSIYVRLLVQHLKDQHYFVQRAAEVASSASAAASEDDRKKVHPPSEANVSKLLDAPAAARTRHGTLADLDFIRRHSVYLKRICSKLKSNHLNYAEYLDLARAVGAAYRSEGLISKRYFVAFGDLEDSFIKTTELRHWFELHVVPEILERA